MVVAADTEVSNKTFLCSREHRNVFVLRNREYDYLFWS